MITLAPSEVPSLLPGAPAPRTPHVNLALAWARGELARRQVDEASLTGDALLAARTAVAAKALAIQAGIGGVVSLEGVAQAGTKRVKVGAIELELTAPMDAQGRAVVAASSWDEYALTFLTLALPVAAPRRLFPGVSR